MKEKYEPPPELPEGQERDDPDPELIERARNRIEGDPERRAALEEVVNRGRRKR